MTPSDIEVLIHCHVSREPHPRLLAPAVQGAIEMFVTSGILDGGGHKGRFRVTAKGRALVGMLCATPFPATKYVDPRLEDD